MFDTMKTIAVAIVVAAITTWFTVGMVGSNQPAIGGETRFPNSNLTAQDITATDDLVVADDSTFGSSAATTSLNFGRTCWTITTDTGSTTFAYFTGIGTNARLATSTASCN